VAEIFEEEANETQRTENLGPKGQPRRGGVLASPSHQGVIWEHCKLPQQGPWWTVEPWKQKWVSGISVVRMVSFLNTLNEVFPRCQNNVSISIVCVMTSH